MKLVIIEPLGVEKEKLLKMADDILGNRVEVTYYDTRVSDTETLISRGKDADIILVSNLPMNEAVINGCKNLKMLSVAFTGIDHIAVEACRKNKITVCNCAGYSTAAVADLVFGLLIGIYRNIIACDRVIRENGTKNGLIGFELEGKKFGIVGTGAIGTRVAAIARAFGAEVYAFSRTHRDIEGVTYVDLDTLLSTCDIVSLHVPLTTDTKGMINEGKLRLMKKNAVLINTARGAVVDSIALANALKNRDIYAAGIDVFETEPPIEATHPILNAPNVVATPHVAFATKEALEKRAVIVLQNVKQWFEGTPQNVML